MTTKTELISDWGRTRPEVELQRRCRHARARSSRCRDLVDCITVTCTPPECATGRESLSRSNLLRSPGRFASPILFRFTKLLRMPQAAPPRFEVTGRPTCNYSQPEDLKQGVLSSGEPQLSKVSGMIATPASLRSDSIHIAGTSIHIALE